MWSLLVALVLASPTTLAIRSAAASQLLIPVRSVWRYEDSGTDLGMAWRDPGYDDSAWAEGPGVLGYGESYIGTTISYGPDPNQKYTTAYFRTIFELTDDPAEIHTFTLSANFDDGFVGYLNGFEVARASLPEGPIGYGTSASSHEGGSYEPFDLSAHLSLLTPGTNTFAVEVHQTSLTSTDLVMDMILVSSTEPVRVLRGPYLQVGTPTQIVVRWRTDRATESVVRYGTVLANLGRVAGTTTLTTEHEVLLDDLYPNTRYYYSVGSTDLVLAGDATHTFVTPPTLGTPKPTRVWVIGDSGLPGPDQDDVRDAYAAYTDGTRTDVWLMLGDNAYSQGTDFEYQSAVFMAYPELLRTTVLWPTRGNHDLIHAGDNNDYYDIFTMPAQGEAGGLMSGTEAYYSFDFANIHFICLDSQGSSLSPGGAMITWLAADLMSTTQDWIISYWHHPPYSKGSHDSDLESVLIAMRTNVLPALEDGGVDLVLTGHSHSYERSFLLDGHYGLSSTLAPEHKIDEGDGRPTGDGAYAKPVGGAAHQGAVYAVVGSSSRLGGGTMDHPVMVASLSVMGSLVLDVEGHRLDATFLDKTGAELDDFTIIRGTGTATDDPGPDDGTRVGLRPAPNPSSGQTRVSFRLDRPGHARVDLFDSAGRRVVGLVDKELGPGNHVATWNGRDEAGSPVASGVYHIRLELDGRVTRTDKLLLFR